MCIRTLKMFLALVALTAAPGLAGPIDLPGPWVHDSGVPLEKLCAVTVMYAPRHPSAVQIHFPGGSCDQEEVALAHALAAILADQGPAKPR